MHEPVTPTPDPGAIVRMPPMPPPSPWPYQKHALIAGGVALLLVVLAIGVGIGRATAEHPETPADTPSERGKLKIISNPADSNVILDGRFVGVAPLEGLDVDPGKHTVVIDLYGYQPYSGTVEVEPRGRAKLTVGLAPLNTEGTTTGTVTGGIASRVSVPRSALLIPQSSAAGAPADAKPAKPAPIARPTITYQRPRRDCSGENRTCRDNCYRAGTDCDFSCPGCSSCNTSTGWDECRRQCETCRRSCDQNKRFCESGCQTANSNCEASQ